MAGEINPEGDVELACSTLGTGPNQPEQLLLDCYVSTSTIYVTVECFVFCVAMRKSAIVQSEEVICGENCLKQMVHENN